MRSIVYWLVLVLVTFELTGCAGKPHSEGSPTGSVTLRWDSSTDPELAGYKIYKSLSSGSYGPAIATLPASVTTYHVTGLATGGTYFFVVSAYDSAGSESLHSNEVARTIP